MFVAVDPDAVVDFENIFNDTLMGEGLFADHAPFVAEWSDGTRAWSVFWIDKEPEEAQSSFRARFYFWRNHYGFQQKAQILIGEQWKMPKRRPEWAG